MAVELGHEENLCVIPARGGSKRIPRKNIKLFFGKPIIAYSIQAALESKLFKEVMVSTDDEEIAQISLDHGASVPFFRSKRNSSDYATTSDVINEVISGYASQKKIFSFCCCIYPAAPFVTSSLLKRAYNKIITGDFDTIVPVKKNEHSIQKILKLENERLSLFFPKYENKRSQDLVTTYMDTGQFYWFKTSLLKDDQSLWNLKTGAIEISEMECQDINNPIDWKMAEIKYQLLNG